MNEPQLQSFASLSPKLLARKGGARPAMRKPNAFTASSGAGADDLGWNDFGDGQVEEGDQPLPEVLRRIEQLAARLSRPARATAAEDAARSAPKEARRAAFTLRLDAERHFRLRMAGVLLDQSAQRIVTEALDQYLSEMPEVAPSPAASKPATKRRRKQAQGS